MYSVDSVMSERVNFHGVRYFMPTQVRLCYWGRLERRVIGRQRGGGS